MSSWPSGGRTARSFGTAPRFLAIAAEFPLEDFESFFRPAIVDPQQDFVEINEHSFVL